MPKLTIRGFTKVRDFEAISDEFDVEIVKEIYYYYYYYYYHHQ
jgi:hypothetical protein